MTVKLEANSRVRISCTVNGKQHTGYAEPRTLLCDFCDTNCNFTARIWAASMAYAVHARSLWMGDWHVPV